MCKETHNIKPLGFQLPLARQYMIYTKMSYFKGLKYVNIYHILSDIPFSLTYWCISSIGMWSTFILVVLNCLLHFEGKWVEGHLRHIFSWKEWHWMSKEANLRTFYVENSSWKHVRLIIDRDGTYSPLVL